MPSYIAKPVSPQLQRAHPLATGLDGAWLMSRASGTRFNDSVSDNNGDVSGATWQAGPSGPVLSFDDGLETYAILNRSAWPVGDYTVAVWFRPFSFNGDFRGLVSNWPNNAPPGRTYLGLVDDNIHAHIGDGSTTGSTALVAGRWYHATLTREGSSCVLWLDGEVENTRTAGVDTYQERTRIGSITTSSFFFDGDVSSVHIYDRALTPSEIRDLYAARYDEFRPRRVIVPLYGALGEPEPTATVIPPPALSMTMRGF